MYNITVLECHKVYEIVISAHYLTQLLTDREAAWPSGQRVGRAFRVRFPLWPLAEFVLGRPEFKSSATLVNSQLVAICLLGFLIMVCCI